MKLENQVTSLELSKKLKELGVKQESLFYWVDGIDDRGSFYGSLDRNTTLVEKIRTERFEEKFGEWSAFTVAELGEMLPPKIISFNIDGHNWKCCFIGGAPNIKTDKMFLDDTEANCRAKMLIWLIENGR